MFRLLRLGYHQIMVSVSVEQYLATAYRPDCDYVDGQVLERNLGLRNHSETQGRAAAWFFARRSQFGLEPFLSMRLQVAERLFRVVDLLLVRQPIPDEEVFTAPTYLCLEVMSPDDTMSSLQDRIDDYLNLGVPNVWVIDPWKRRAWTVTAAGWRTSLDGLLRTADGLIPMLLSEVLPAATSQSTTT